MEDQPPTGCGCIDRVVQAPEPDLPIPKASDEINQMTQASANAIQSPHDQYILAVAQIAERSSAQDDHAARRSLDRRRSAHSPQPSGHRPGRTHPDRPLTLARNQ